MKQVTIETVRERIAELNCLNADGVLSLRGEFELACLRQLVAHMQSVQVLPSGWKSVQVVQVVPEKCPAEIRDLLVSHSDALFNDDDAQEIWNACRAAMLHKENATKWWHGLYNEIKGRGQRSEGDFTPDLSMSTEEIIDAINKRRAAMLNQTQEPATDNTAQQFEALASGHPKTTDAPIIPEGLHPDTADLVIRFATALAEKLHRAEQKYGHANGWKAPGWYNECLQQLWEHIEKGDPRDVAAYCAFMWHHGWVTTDYDRGVQQALSTSAQPEIIGYEPRMICGEPSRVPKFKDTSAQREPLAVVKHYTGNTYPTLKFAQDEWCICGDRDDAQELADAINALATSAGSGKP